MTELNTSNMTSQEAAIISWPGGPGLERRGILQKSPYGQEWSVIKPLGILGSEVASESKWKNFKCTTTRTRGGGRYKIQGGISATRCGSE
jgi:hypothetical protein